MPRSYRRDREARAHTRADISLVGVALAWPPLFGAKRLRSHHPPELMCQTGNCWLRKMLGH